MDKFQRRTWAEINLDHLNYNLQNIKNGLSKDTKVMAVVKADGYGHGDKMIAQTLEENGVDFFAVSNLEEGISLRNNGSNAQILVLGYTPTEDIALLKKYDLIQTIYSTEYAHDINEFCCNNNITIPVHIKLDSGMGRLGFDCDDTGTINTIKSLYSLSSLRILGYFSHLSSADMCDTDSKEYTSFQQLNFFKLITHLKNDNFAVGTVHIQNSAGMMCYKSISDENTCTYTRTGIILYGVYPSLEVEKTIELKPVMELKSVVAMVKTVSEGHYIGYGRSFCTTKETTIATIPIGYADGYARKLSKVGTVLIRGVHCHILGNICMDQLMVDVSDVPNVKVGDIVTLIGKDKDSQITFDDIANLTGTISYEVMCVLGRRVPRVYIKNNQIFDAVEYINRKKHK